MKRISFVLLFIVAGLFIYAQPFAREFDQFKKEDSTFFPAKGKILFIGSSSFTIWQDVQNYFPGYPILNRGFGGSALPDIIQRANEVIFKYDPKQIVIYCGENDLAVTGGVSSDTVLQRFKTLFCMIRCHYPDIPVVFVSIKPSPSRSNLMPQMVEVNRMIKKFLRRRKFTNYVDVYHAMLNANGQPKPEIFRADSLHMLAAGYKIWKPLIEPVLLK